MTLTEKKTFLQHQIRHDRSSVRWWVKHRHSRVALIQPHSRFLIRSQRRSLKRCQAIGIRAPAKVCVHARRMRKSMRALQRVEERIAYESLPPDCRGTTVEACSWYEDGATQCETDHEGGWTSVDPSGTYAGRFQSDYGFETGTAFGAQMENEYGRASNWPSWAQIQHAYEMWLALGWRPWPPYYRFGCSSYHGGTYR